MSELVIAGLVVAGAVGYLVMQPKPPQRNRAGRSFLHAMDEVQREAAARKIEQFFADSPGNPYLAPLNSLTPGPQVPKSG